MTYMATTTRIIFEASKAFDKRQGWMNQPPSNQMRLVLKKKRLAATLQRSSSTDGNKSDRH
jgi:hypothetical protein